MSQRQLTLVPAILLRSVLRTLVRLLDPSGLQTGPGTQKAGRIVVCPLPPPPHLPPPRSLQGLLPPGRRQLEDTETKLLSLALTK
jgi:hypothetical protein